jgi:hypothetical protein
VGMEKDLTFFDMNRMFSLSTYRGLTRPILDYPMDPIGEYLPEAAR